jgi:hypothetical protein
LRLLGPHETLPGEDRMRTRWLEPLIISLGLTSIAVVGCNKDGNDENADENGDGDGDSSSESAESTMTGDGDTTTGDGDTSCLPGELGCECNDGQCLGDLVCTNGICSDPDCLPGELACECNDGECLGDLICIDGVCLEDGGTSTDTTTDTTADTDTTTDTGMECPNANEMLCDGVCVDVLENEEHCGECGQICEYGFETQLGICEDGQCGPFWSDCYEQADGFTTCNEICANEGQACVEGGCTYTWTQSDSPGFCITDSPGGNGTLGACDTEFIWTDSQLRCCCTQ